MVVAALLRTASAESRTNAEHITRSLKPIPAIPQRGKRMVYRLLGDAVIVLHFLWILFILFGLFVGIKYGRLICVHLGGLVLTLILNIGGWFCPLTYLENHLYRLYNPQLAYAGSFIGQYLQKLIYLDVDEAYLRMAAVIWVAINLGGYVLRFKKRKAVYR